MDPRFAPNNTHLKNAETFTETDPHLQRLYAEPYVYRSYIIDEIPRDTDAIVTLGGGRQVGKTTLLKQWMETLLKQGHSPQAIAFFSGELINDHQNLYRILHAHIQTMPKEAIKYIILDEVTDISDWDKAIKYLADTGDFRKMVVVLSDSDLVLMQDARKRFPGRRGKASKVNFHYYPLSFKEYLTLKETLPDQDNVTETVVEGLYKEFDHYLIHGGFLTAINEYASKQSISQATLATYSDWIRGDVLKRNKGELFLQEIIEAIIKHYLKQISWTNLVKELSIDHTQTIANYIELLSSMDAVFVQAAIIEDKLKPAPKKQKKIMFTDPFIYHAMCDWLSPSEDPFTERILPIFNNPSDYAALVESCVTTHFRRFYPTYYIKAEGEVDIAYVDNNKFWPIEIKWETQLRPKSLKQIQKYKNGKIFSKANAFSKINSTPILPLPLALLDLPR